MLDSASMVVQAVSKEYGVRKTAQDLDAQV
jgi:hypothetical protein